MFDTAWSCKKSGSIFKGTGDKTGADASIEQLQSAHPGLVPQFWGEIKITKQLGCTGYDVSLHQFGACTFHGNYNQRINNRGRDSL